ncbi:cleft lip and palate associated transmembrane protein 1 [Patellaria atrata CBS 101060]|uniref:Cleft lip and palate associated transmembrane protein 1 n=1 Tax=Patellaria atrata CBS 101060 TaxID=1346257 RepID=A0A9P4SEJ7_9PEZI|nr:cleft lip and palate associated transmembrane protein 1 [Patellaria atrata CBS 101060]
MPEQQQPQEEQAWSSGFFRTALQSVGIFLLIQFASKQFFGAPQKPAHANVPGAPAAVVGKSGPIPAFSARPSKLNDGALYSGIPNDIAPIWPLDSPIDVSLYISTSVIMPSLAKLPADSKVLEEKNFKMGNHSDYRVVEKEIRVPKEVQNNGTLFGHYYVGLTGATLDPLSPVYDASRAYHFVRPITQYLPKKKKAKKHNLLSGPEAEEEEEVITGFGNYYHPNFTISMIPDSGVLNYLQVAPAVRQFVQLEPSGARDASGRNAWYYPILYVNTFWQLKDHMTELNRTVETLPIKVDLKNLRNWQFTLMSSIDEGAKENARRAARGEAGVSGGDGSEIEMFKSILIDSNMYLLATTAVVSVLHMIFEMLAFKNDVSHWRKKKDNVGTSLRTILANVFMQSVIFLYLLDNNENTSWMILFGQGTGIAIEAWKITKTVDVRIRQNPPGSLLPYSIRFEDKHKLSDTEKKTQEYDEIAFKYLYIVAVPLLLAYAIYSLLYESHKSWYSFVIATLVGSVYAYGFLMMVPSLYINYRLKSVAHMPAKAMTYKFLNTFIDDLFAFTIKMPTLHRLATLRDDVIFFVYLYQSYKYKVDYSRVNEFGQGGDDEEMEEKVANKPLTSPAGGDAGVKEGEKVIKEAKEAVQASGKGMKGEAKKRRG